MSKVAIDRLCSTSGDWIFDSTMRQASLVHRRESRKASYALNPSNPTIAGCVGDSGKNYPRSASCFRSIIVCFVCSWSVCSWPFPALSVRWLHNLHTPLDSDHLPLTSAASFRFTRSTVLCMSHQNHSGVLVRVDPASITVIPFQFSHTILWTFVYIVWEM